MVCVLNPLGCICVKPVLDEAPVCQVSDSGSVTVMVSLWPMLGTSIQSCQQHKGNRWEVSRRPSGSDGGGMCVVWGLPRERWFIEGGKVCVFDPMVRNFTTLRWGHSGGVEGVDHWCRSSMGSPHKMSGEPAPHPC